MNTWKHITVSNKKKGPVYTKWDISIPVSFINQQTQCCFVYIYTLFTWANACLTAFLTQLRLTFPKLLQGSTPVLNLFGSSMQGSGFSL